MKNLEKTLKYYELILKYENISDYPKYQLPDDYTFVFYESGNIKDWVDIHFYSGEFANYEAAIKIFHDFFDDFSNELNKRCVFIQNNKGEFVGTGTISKSPKNPEVGIVDWIAIKKEYQNKGLAKPLLTKLFAIANSLKHQKIVLHTSTHNWLAAKIYLDMGFEPVISDSSYFGWQIIKTLTNHGKLKNIPKLNTIDMYSEEFIKIENKLQEIHQDNFNYEIWYIDNRNDVYVYDFKKFFQYKYFIQDDQVILKLVG